MDWIAYFANNCHWSNSSIIVWSLCERLVGLHYPRNSRNMNFTQMNFDDKKMDLLKFNVCSFSYVRDYAEQFKTLNISHQELLNQTKCSFHHKISKAIHEVMKEGIRLRQYPESFVIRRHGYVSKQEESEIIYELMHDKCFIE